MLEKALEVQFDFPANVKKKQKKTSLNAHNKQVLNFDDYCLRLKRYEKTLGLWSSKKDGYTDIT